MAPRRPKTVVIEGQEWQVQRDSWRETDRTGRSGGYTTSAWKFTRVSDGRTMTSASKERGTEIIAQRIRDGIYPLKGLGYGLRGESKMTKYINPAAAVGACKRKGRKAPEAVFACALREKGGKADRKWKDVAWNLAQSAGLSGASLKTKRKRYKRTASGYRLITKNGKRQYVWVGKKPKFGKKPRK